MYYYSKEDMLIIINKSISIIYVIRHEVIVKLFIFLIQSVSKCNNTKTVRREFDRYSIFYFGVDTYGPIIQCCGEFL